MFKRDFGFEEGKEEIEFIFDDEETIKSLRTGKNPNELRIYCLASHALNTTYLFMDRISGEKYAYIPSKKNKDGKPLGYSIEEIITSNGDRAIAEICEYSDNRGLDKYRVKEHQVTFEEYKAFLSNRKKTDNLTKARNR